MTAGGGEAIARAPTRTPFVGREAELDWLLERVHQAARGRPRACLVRGEPGIGKSRLLAELGLHALGEGLRIWSLRGSPDLQTPYLALDPLIQELAARCLCGPALAEARARWWQHLERDRGGEPGVLAIAPFGPSQRALSRAFQRAALERAMHGGFLILIDDFQWLDGSSLELVSELIAAASEEPTGLVVVMASPGSAPGTAAGTVERRLELELICDTLPLRGLGDRESEDFLRALGIDAPTRALATRLREVAHGKPERLQRIVYELRRRGALERRGSSWITTLDPLELADDKSTSLDISPEDPLRQTLALLGLFTTGASSEALAAIGGGSREAVEDELADAEARGWLQREAGRFTFGDPALGRALAAEIPEAALPALHHRIARWLEETGQDDPELLAHHWQRAWPEAASGRVLAAMRAAASQAMGAHDWRRAAFHYEGALHVAGRSDVALAAQAELHYRAGLAHYRSLDGEPARVHFEQAARAYEQAGDPIGALRALLEHTRARVSLSAAVYGSSAPDLAELERRVDAVGAVDASLHAYALGQLAEARAMARDTKAAEPLARRAVAVAESASDDVRCLTYEILGIVLMGKLDLDGAAEAFRESLRIGRRAGDAWLESLALNRLPIVLGWQGRLDEARSYLLAARESADETGDWADYSLALGMLAALALARGAFEEVESLARQAVSIARRSGYLWGAALAISAVAPARALSGRLDQARDAAGLLETLGALAREVPPAWGAVAALLRLRLSALAGQKDAAAHERAGELVGVLLATETDPQILPALCSCVEIAALHGDAELAERAATRIESAAGCGVVFTSALDDVLARVLGLAAEASGRREEARACFEQALEAAERGGARMLQARIHADLARVQAALGDAEGARRNCERALAFAELLGMEPLRAACAERLMGGETVGSLRERPELLKADERRLLRGIAGGLDAQALAADLLLTREGLGRLREGVFARIGVSRNVEAAAFAHREGLVEPARRGVATPLAEITLQSPPVHGREPRALTLFVSDIANSSELIQRLGDEAAQQLIHAHNRIVRANLHQHQGVELQQTGDGFIATFEGASQALRCAVGLQRALDAARLGPPEALLRVRVGLHLGEPLLEEGRLFGVSMHTAARICGSCEGGEVRVSHGVWRRADGGSQYRADALGPVALKGIFDPVTLHRVHWWRGGSNVAV